MGACIFCVFVKIQLGNDCFTQTEEGFQSSFHEIRPSGMIQLVFSAVHLLYLLISPLLSYLQ